MGNVRFELDAESGKAVAAFLKVVDAQKKTEDGMRRVVRSGDGLEGVGRELGKLAASFATLATVRTVANNYVQDVTRMGEASSRFEDVMTELLSLGDNMNRRGALKEQVLSLSGAMGKSAQEVAETIATLQGAAPNLDAAIQESLLRGSFDLGRLTNTETRTSLMLLTKAYQSYRDELGSVERAQSRLFGIAEAGDIRFRDLAENFPEVMSAARAMGFAFDDVGASLAVASLRAGKTAPTYTALRNVILKVNDATREGIPLSGSFVDRLEQLSQRLSAMPTQQRQDMLKKIFGEDAIAIAQVLLENVRDIRKELLELKSVPDDIVAKKIGVRLTDPAYMASEVRKRAMQAAENAAIADPKTAWKETEYQMRVAGAKSDLPLGLKWLAEPFAMAETYLPGSRALGKNLQQQLAALEASGQWTEAGYLRLKYADALGTTIPYNPDNIAKAMGKPGFWNDWAAAGLEPGGIPTAKDAERFLQLRNRGFNITLPAFLHMRAMEAERNAPAVQSEMSRAAGIRAPEDYLRSGLRGFVDFVDDLKGVAQTMKDAAEAFQRGADRQQGNLARDRLPTTRPVNPNAHVE